MEGRNRLRNSCGDEYQGLNMAHAECSLQIEAKACGCNENRTFAYSIVDNVHGLCLGKREIILAQKDACERLLNLAHIMKDRIVLLAEIVHLKLMLKLA